MAFDEKKHSDEFKKRFVTALGTGNASVISDYLEISYQAAKNYLNGRLPEPRVLIKIAEKTPYSVHWLLTGEGEKYVDHAEKSEAELLAAVLSDIADAKTLRRMFEVVSEQRIRAALRESKSVPFKAKRTVKIKKEDIRKERALAPKSSPVEKK